MKHQAIPPETEQVARLVLDAAFAVHKALGPGLLESVYEACICHELELLGITVQRQYPVKVRYRGIELETGFRVDVLVGSLLVLELKSIDALLPVHEAQLLTYLRLTGCRLGFLMNFNVGMLRDGIKRMVN